jgi:hypothetical protein
MQRFRTDLCSNTVKRLEIFDNFSSLNLSRISPGRERKSPKDESDHLYDANLVPKIDRKLFNVI